MFRTDCIKLKSETECFSHCQVPEFLMTVTWAAGCLITHDALEKGKTQQEAEEILCTHLKEEYLQAYVFIYIFTYIYISYWSWVFKNLYLECFSDHFLFY